VLIDTTHRKWMVASTIVAVAGVVTYVAYSALSVTGPSGGSVVGLTYGSIASAMMLFAVLLGLRRRFPTWRVGRGTTWMRGHLWLGLLSFPIVLLHSGFSFGSGTLTRTLMVLFAIVFVSGIFGAVMQVLLPRMMTERVPLETVYDQIAHVREQLLAEAEIAINDVCAVLEGDLSGAELMNRAAAASAGTIIDFTVASGLATNPRLSATVRECFESQIKPYLMRAGSGGLALAKPAAAEGTFRSLRVLLPERLATGLNEVQSICEEKRQLDRQRILHHLLHGWLMVHVPLSYALVLLGAIHALVALRY
jgi:hypothetical protein